MGKKREWMSDVELAAASSAMSNPLASYLDVGAARLLLDEVEARRRSECDAAKRAKVLEGHLAKLAAAAKNLALATSDTRLRAELERCATLCAKAARGELPSEKYETVAVSVEAYQAADAAYAKVFEVYGDAQRARQVAEAVLDALGRELT